MRWSPVAPKKIPQQACQILGIKIETLIPAIAAKSNCDSDKCYDMTEDDMRAYIGTPQFVPLEPNYFSCIDGRHDNEVIATPGGDMGLFLSAAEVYIRGSSSPSDYSQSRMELLLRDFIKAFRSPTNQFYMHTDEHALHRAHEKLAEKGVDDGVGLDELASDTFVPPPAAKYVLLSALSDMAIGVGCGHIKNMVPAPPRALCTRTPQPSRITFAPSPCLQEGRRRPPPFSQQRARSV